MKISKNLLVCIISFITFTAAAALRTIYKDVAIVGGGASGAHAAVRLREDYKKSIIIVEKQYNLVLPLSFFMILALDLCFTRLSPISRFF
jgi:hypothetical protein